MATKPGLYANIHAKQERIKAGSGEKMRKPGASGAPTAKAFKESAKTAKKGKLKCRLLSRPAKKPSEKTWPPKLSRANR